MNEFLKSKRIWNYLREYGIRSTICGARNMFFNKTFKLWERLGIHITPVHFYQPIPDTKELILRRKLLWKNSELVGVDLNKENQLRFLYEIFPRYRDEYAKFPKDKSSTSSEHEFYFNDSPFIAVDAEVLYCMVRYFKPSKIIEVGSGFSTLLIAQALRANKEESKDSKQIVIDPYPRKMIKSLPDVSLIIPKKCQEMDLDFFQQLESGDILFIDSSHVVKIGSEVNYLTLEVLPRLKKGVIVHVHDIFLPSEYPEEWILGNHRFWTEQYLLQAFLIYNNAFEVLWGGSYMHLNHPEKLKSTFPSYSKDDWPGSFWMRKKNI